jgi:hypothetical protein
MRTVCATFPALLSVAPRGGGRLPPQLLYSRQLAGDFHVRAVCADFPILLS